MYRLHIDIPINTDLNSSSEIAKKVIKILEEMKVDGVELAQYRLSNDEDRGNKNYLDINENGHCTNKKIVIRY